MAIQLPLPARWARLESRRSDPRGRLDALHRDVLDTKVAIRAARVELAARRRIPTKDITYAVEGYVDDMLSDAVFHVKRGLEGVLV